MFLFKLCHFCKNQTSVSVLKFQSLFRFRRRCRGDKKKGCCSIGARQQIWSLMFYPSIPVCLTRRTESLLTALPSWPHTGRVRRLGLCTACVVNALFIKNVWHATVLRYRKHTAVLPGCWSITEEAPKKKSQYFTRKRTVFSGTRFSRGAPRDFCRVPTKQVELRKASNIITEWRKADDDKFFVCHRLPLKLSNQQLCI